MTEYIKRLDALNAIGSITMYRGSIPFDTAKWRIKDIPAADVRPVVRGKWERDGQCNILRCSECDTPSMNAQNFCSVCGADMRGDNNG